nr:hypothetical protein [Tanacetum cinerariifolium]
MQELREDTFFGNKNEDVHDHVDRVLNIGPILRMRPTQALTTIQTMADHSQKWHDGTSSRNISSSSSDTDGLAAVIHDKKSKNTELKTSKKHVEEALVNETMESLKKIKINRPLFKEIRQTNNYPKYIKGLAANNQLTEEVDEVRMNLRCPDLLQNHLPPKESDPGSFILPCFIGWLDFNNALADLGTSISVMLFSMFKCLGIGKLEPIDIVIEMADDTKCIPKWIVKNLVTKIDKFIIPVDFIILDMNEDFRMPVILGRPFLATAHAKVDIFRKTIS